MDPSEIRTLILEDHVWLRGEFAKVDGLARRVLEGEEGLEEELRRRGEEIRGRFLRHLALEDAYLVPALREADSWGEERARRVEVEHAEQRADMDRLLEDLRDRQRPADEIAKELRELVTALLTDMEQEEASCLDPRVLRDDVVVIDAEGG